MSRDKIWNWMRKKCKMDNAICLQSGIKKYFSKAKTNWTPNRRGKWI